MLLGHLLQGGHPGLTVTITHSVPQRLIAGRSKWKRTIFHALGNFCNRFRKHNKQRIYQAFTLWSEGEHNILCRFCFPCFYFSLLWEFKEKSVAKRLSQALQIIQFTIQFWFKLNFIFFSLLILVFYFLKSIFLRVPT